MPDMSEFDAQNLPVYNRKKVAILLEQMERDNDERLPQLRAALDDPGYTSAAIARVLRSWGFDISADTVQNYRRTR